MCRNLNTDISQQSVSNMIVIDIELDSVVGYRFGNDNELTLLVLLVFQHIFLKRVDSLLELLDGLL